MSFVKYISLEILLCILVVSFVSSYLRTRLTTHHFLKYVKGFDLDIDVEWKTKKEILSLIKKGAMHEDRSVGVLMRYLG